MEQLKAGVFPSNWVFLPVAGKATYVRSWAQSRMTLPELEQEYVKDSRYRGLGVITGEASGGLIALDIDGLTAAARLKAAIGEENYEKRGRESSMSWTSGKRGRRQILWKVPAALVPQLREFNTLILRENGEWEPGTGDKNRIKRADDQPAYEEVVLRFNRCQSVLPGSPRPGSNYKRYHWLNYNEGRPADAPRWVVELLLQQCKPVTWLNSDDQKQLGETHGETAVPPAQIRGWFFGENVQRLLQPKLRDLIFKHPVFDEYGWNERPGANEQWMSGCPWHKSESGTAFQVAPSSGVWCCHACGNGGDVLKFVHAARTNDPYAENPTGPTLEGYVAEIAGKLGFKYPDDVLPTQRVANKVPTPEDLEELYKKCRQIDKKNTNKEKARMLMWAEAQQSAFYLFKSGTDIYDSYRRYYTGELTPAAEVQTIAQLEAIKESDYLIPDFVRTGSSIMLHARGGLGKTKVALALARTIGQGCSTRIRGSDFTPTSTGKVLLLGADMSSAQYIDYLKQQGIDVKGADHHWMKVAWDWEIDQQLELIDLLNEHQPKLVIIDSLSSVSNNAAHGENDQEYARTVYDMSRHNGRLFPPTCFMWIHHNRKDGTTFRGTDVLRNAVDDTWELMTIPEEEQGSYAPGSKILQIGKSRGMRDGARFIVKESLEECITIEDLASLVEHRQGTGDMTGPSMVRKVLKEDGPLTADEVKAKVDGLVLGIGNPEDKLVSLSTIKRWLKREVAAATAEVCGMSKPSEKGGRPAPLYRWKGVDPTGVNAPITPELIDQLWGAAVPPESGNESEREDDQNPPSTASASSGSVPAQGISAEGRFRSSSEISGESEGRDRNLDGPGSLTPGTGGPTAGLPKSSTSSVDSGISAIPNDPQEFRSNEADSYQRDTESAPRFRSQGVETASSGGQNGISLIPNGQKLVEDFGSDRNLSAPENAETPSGTVDSGSGRFRSNLPPLSLHACGRVGAGEELDPELQELLDLEAQSDI